MQKNSWKVVVLSLCGAVVVQAKPPVDAAGTALVYRTQSDTAQIQNSNTSPMPKFRLAAAENNTAAKNAGAAKTVAAPQAAKPGLVIPPFQPVPQRTPEFPLKTQRMIYSDAD